MKLYFSEKLKSLRKQFNMSQEQLAEKLNVSRQAVTKWETGNGMPDIDNILSIAALFNLSVDKMLCDEKRSVPESGFLTESLTRYDIDGEKHYDIDLGGAYEVRIQTTDSEKIHVKLSSNAIEDLDSSFKVKIDDLKKRLDIKVNRTDSITEALAKQALYIAVHIPKKYFLDAEVKVFADTLILEDMDINSIEIDGKVSNVQIKNVSAHLELNSSLDMNIMCDNLNGRIDVNQINAASKISIPKGTSYYAKKRGMSNKFNFTLNDKPYDSKADKSSENMIELAGLNSELTINEYNKEN